MYRFESSVNRYYHLLFQFYVTVIDGGVSSPPVNGPADFNNAVPAVCDFIFHVLSRKKFNDGDFREAYISRKSVKDKISTMV